MTPEELAAIEARAATATPGTLEADGYTIFKRDFQNNYPVAYIKTGSRAFADTKFFAHARTDIPALLAEIRRLHEVINRLG